MLPSPFPEKSSPEITQNCQELDGSGLLGVSKILVLQEQGDQWFNGSEFRGELKAQTGQEMRGILGLSRNRRIQDWR